MSSLLSIALLVCFMGLTVVIVRLCLAVRDCSKLVGQMYDDHRVGMRSGGATEMSVDSLSDLGIGTGKRTPDWLDLESRGGRWSIVVLVPSSEDSLPGHVAAELVPLLSDRYVLTILSPDAKGADSESEGLIARPEPRLERGQLSDSVAGHLSRPFVLLVDPHRVVQGTGMPDTAADVIAFVVEGEERGFGPSRRNKRLLSAAGG